MSSSLIGFAIFETRPFARHPLTAAETVLIQTVASTTGMMILSVGFAGVFPALEFLLKSHEGAPVDLGVGQLILWGLGICLVGSTFSAFLRKQMILKEKLKYPTGTATAALISVLHGVPNEYSLEDEPAVTSASDENAGLMDSFQTTDSGSARFDGDALSTPESNADHAPAPAKPIEDLRRTYIRYLIIALAFSALFVSFPWYSLDTANFWPCIRALQLHSSLKPARYPFSGAILQRIGFGRLTFHQRISVKGLY
jgi:hypothetical protein